MTQPYHDDWTLLCHLNYGKEGKLISVKKTDQGFAVKTVPSTPAKGPDLADIPVILGMNGETVFLLDMVSKVITQASNLPLDADPSYAYPDYDNNRLWFVNDGDKETGNDPVCCDNNGSPITILQPGPTPRVIGNLCAGRGHHVTTFIPARENRKALAFVSNLLDGTIFVLGNDINDNNSFLKVIATINLCEPDKEKEADPPSVPNNAFPHGMVYSSITDRIYNLNNGYGTIAVISPDTFGIEALIAMKKCSNLLISPNQRFAIGKGADRKTNPQHVMGRISIVDLERGQVVTELDIKDVYPSTYRFSPKGDRLYVTTASTGKGEQKANLKMDKLLIYDASELPNISLIKELDVGVADCGRRPLAYTEYEGNLKWLFIPNPTDGTLSIIDGVTDTLVETVTLGESNINEVLFSFWQPSIKGS